jgi:transposase-like protein
MKKNLSALTLVHIMKRFPDAETARVYLEKMRWPDGVVCPHCSESGAYTLTAKATSAKPGRKGLYKCKACRKQFTVTVGTIFEDSHISLDKWLIAIYLMCSSKKGMSAHQIHRMLNMSYKAAWFMCHRIRYAMAHGPIAAKLGGGGRIVEADETYIGGKRRNVGSGSKKNKQAVMTVIERGGRVRSFHMERVTSDNLREVLNDNVELQTRLMTDEAQAYKYGAGEYSRETVNHSQKEYARGDVHINSAEGFFGLLKRGINGVYHHVGPHHLHRYLAEFDFRWNNRETNDGTRTDMAIIGFEGKRLKYKD